MVPGHRSESLLERTITNGRNTTWLDVQRQYVDIVQRPQPRLALHAVTAVAVAMVVMAPTPRRAAPGLVIAVAVAAAGPAAAQGRAAAGDHRASRSKTPRAEQRHRSQYR